MTYANILFEKSSGIAEITFNRPATFNAFDFATSEELADAVVRCYSDDEVRAVIFTGAGNAFAAGGDVKAMAEILEGDPPTFFLKLTGILHSLIASIGRLPKPVIAAINGVTAGGGLSFALACDLAIASEKAKFITSYTAIGLAPDLGLSFNLPRLVGVRKALELLYTNRVLSAQDALQLGLVNEVAPPDELMARARALAQKLAQGPTRAFGATKLLVNNSHRETLETQLELERQVMGVNTTTEDFREGIRAFVEKRAPEFKGH